MKVVVLEPDGKHWQTDVPEDRLRERGFIFSAAHPAPVEANVATLYAREPLPYLQRIDYEGLEILDADGRHYWVFARRKGQ